MRAGPGWGQNAGGWVVVVAFLLLPFVGTAACGSGEEVVFPEDEQPFLYLVLNQTGVAAEPVQTAFLLTLVSADSTVYRSAERFEMRRLRDGAPFDWRNESVFGSIEFDQGSDLQLIEGNYLLSDTATARGLGFENLEPGATYELVVETDGRVIRGRATIPDTFDITILDIGEEEATAAWPDVAGAAGYSVTAAGDDVTEPVFQTDTTFDLRPGTVSVTVRAVGPQAFRYVTDEDVRSAGIQGALGVFGAVQAAEFPPETSAESQRAPLVP